jgi:arsenate reductase
MKLKIAFVCVHNSCRSQMAEAWAKTLGSDLLEVYSAGTEEYAEVKPLAVSVMEEMGIDMSGHKPKLLTDIPDELDILITMGCNVVCPFVSNRHAEDWGLTDPSGGPIEDYRVTRDLIKDKVLDLLKRLETQDLLGGFTDEK